MRYIVVMTIIFVTVALSQTVYEIPFGSRDNVVELVVVNSSGNKVEGVRVEVVDMPKGITFTEGEVLLTEVKPKGEHTVVFSFTVEKTVEIGKDQVIVFAITDNAGRRWTKEIVIKVSPPKVFELYQNWPNPFNPFTTISYQLPDVGVGYNVSLSIYDILGREVLVISREQVAGYYEERIDGSKLCSGLYIYRLYAKAMDGSKTFTSTKKMVLMK